MKKTILLLAFSFQFVTYSQIILDFEHQGYYLLPIQVSNTSVKFLKYPYDSLLFSSFSLLNPDGSLYKEITLPPKPNKVTRISAIMYPSMTLFDSDSTTLEYMVDYQRFTGSRYFDQIRIAREDGTILFDEPFLSIPYGSLAQFPYLAPFFKIGHDTKMMLYYSDTINSLQYGTRVYSLPGQLPSSVNSLSNDINYPISVFPNPSNGSFWIVSKTENQTKQIEVFSMEGKLVRKYISESAVTKISDVDLPAGAYLINIANKKWFQSTKLIIEK